MYSTSISPITIPFYVHSAIHHIISQKGCNYFHNNKSQNCRINEGFFCV